MAAKAVWKGTIGFGLVSVPVKMYSSTDEKTVHFNQLHRECGTKIQLKKWCSKCEKHLDTQEIMKGYPVGDDQFIHMTDEDFAKVPGSTIENIQVVAFVDPASIDPRHYIKSYILSPDKAGVKAFSLFLKALESVGKVAVAQWAFKEKEYVATVRVLGGCLLLQTLYYADELRSVAEFEPALAEISDKEMEMAVTLVNTLATDDLDMDQFEDRRRKAILSIIEAKTLGQEYSPADAPKEAPKMDLADALMASINQAKAKSEVA